MKECKIYQGQLDDGTLDNQIPFLVSKAMEFHEPVYAEWNGVMLYITEKSSPESIIKQYHNGLTKESLFNQHNRGKLISYNDLGNKLATILEEVFKKYE